MEWVKTTAKTLPEAIDLALDNLGVDESEAEIVVVEEPRPGLFGRMRGTARVEARVKPKAIRPKADRNRNRRNRAEGKGGGDRSRSRKRGGQGGNRNRGRDDARSGSEDEQRNESRSGGGRRRNRGDEGRGDEGRGGRGGRGGGRGRQEAGGEARQDGGRDRGGRAASGGGDGGGQRRNDRDRDSDVVTPKEETPVEEVAAHLQTFLRGLTEAFGFDSEVTVDSSEPDVLVGRIEGRHGLLVGPKGRTLDAVQELARISCQRSVPSSVRIKVDVGGYRQERTEALTAFARQAADRAADEQSEVSLEPMSAADRKVIHDALSDDDRVETQSVGTEPRRKVLVVPVAEWADDDDDDLDDDDLDDAAMGGSDDGVSADADTDAEADADAEADDDAADDAEADDEVDVLADAEGSDDARNGDSPDGSADDGDLVEAGDADD